MTNRRTDLTEQQRQAMQQARRLLAPHFPGETLRLYVPQRSVECKMALQADVRQALERGEPPAAIARRLGITDRYVRALRGRFVQREAA